MENNPKNWVIAERSDCLTDYEFISKEGHYFYAPSVLMLIRKVVFTIEPYRYSSSIIEHFIKLLHANCDKDAKLSGKSVAHLHELYMMCMDYQYCDGLKLCANALLQSKTEDLIETCRILVNTSNTEWQCWPSDLYQTMLLWFFHHSNETKTQHTAQKQVLEDETQDKSQKSPDKSPEKSAEKSSDERQKSQDQSKKSQDTSQKSQDKDQYQSEKSKNPNKSSDQCTITQTQSQDKNSDKSQETQDTILHKSENQTEHPNNSQETQDTNMQEEDAKNKTQDQAENGKKTEPIFFARDHLSNFHVCEWKWQNGIFRVHFVNWGSLVDEDVPEIKLFQEWSWDNWILLHHPHKVCITRLQKGWHALDIIDRHSHPHEIYAGILGRRNHPRQWYAKENCKTGVLIPYDHVE